MKFTLDERFKLNNILFPLEESMVNLRIIRDFRMLLAPSDAEKVQFEIAENKLPNGVKYPSWNEEKANGVFFEIPVGVSLSKVISERMKELDKQKKFNELWIPLYERFVEGKKTPEDIADEAAAAALKEVNKDVQSKSETPS